MADNHIPNERRLYEYKSVYTNTDNTIDNTVDDKIMENLHQPLIIDGVDVSGCEFRFCTYGCDCMSSNRETKVLTESAHCSDNHNCYYKQLKRKEQVGKNAQSELIEANKQVIYLAKQLDQLQKSNEELQTENERLKKQVCGLRPELKCLIDDTCCKYNIEVKTYHEKIVEIIHHLNMYDQTLADIKEIAKNMNKECFYNDFSCDGCDMINGCTYQGKINTLQKIREVKE